MSEINNGYMSKKVFDSLEELIEKLNTAIKEQVATIKDYNEQIIKYSNSPSIKIYEPTKNNVDVDLKGKTFDQIIGIAKELEEIVKSQKLTISIQENEIKELQKIRDNTVEKEEKNNKSTEELSTKGIFDNAEDTPFSSAEDLNKDINKIF